MTQPLWVFGYGSLIWNPGFAHGRREIARATGYARSFCMLSIHHRGTPEEPGLVLALDAAAGASCLGVAFEVPEVTRAETLDYLRERELVSSAYLEVTLPLDLEGGERIEALTYVVDPNHRQYCGGMALEEQARVIAQAHGGRGPNHEYLSNTAAHLDEIGIADAELSWLSARVAALRAGG